MRLCKKNRLTLDIPPCLFQFTNIIMKENINFSSIKCPSRYLQYRKNENQYQNDVAIFFKKDYEVNFLIDMVNLIVFLAPFTVFCFTIVVFYQYQNPQCIP